MFVPAVFSGKDTLLDEDMFLLKALHILDTFYCSALLLFTSWMCIAWCKNWHKPSTGLHIMVYSNVLGNQATGGNNSVSRMKFGGVYCVTACCSLVLHKSKIDCLGTELVSRVWNFMFWSCNYIYKIIHTIFLTDSLKCVRLFVYILDFVGTKTVILILWFALILYFNSILIFNI